MSLLHRLISIILPQVCVNCGIYDNDTPLCTQCEAELLPSKAIGVNWIFAIYNYDNAIIKKIVYAFKYYNKYNLIEHMGRISSDKYWNIISKYITINDLHIRTIIMIPIPLSPDRYIMRGYNQSELLAQAIIKSFAYTEEKLSFTIQNIIRRDSVSIKLSHTASIDERQAAIANSFSLTREAVCTDMVNTSDNSSGQTLYILIDDVTTTGSTLYAARQLLLQQNINEKNIIALTLAH